MKLRTAPFAVGFGIVRLQADCLIVVRDGFLVPVKLNLRGAPAAVGFGRVRLQADFRVAVRDDFLEPAADCSVQGRDEYVGFRL